MVVLNERMTVQVWNHAAEDQWGLRGDEVVGQHFLNLDIGLPVDELAPAIRAGLAGQATDVRPLFVEAVNRRGRTITCEVTVSPLRDDGDRPTGAILLIDASHLPAGEE